MRAPAAMVMGLATSVVAQAQQSLALYAAGSLREALTTVAGLWHAQGGAPVALTFGASGLLRELIEKGEPAQAFASADTIHPQRLGAGGTWEAPVVFTRNTLCALTAANVVATPQNLLATLLREDVRLGTSTPLTDPSGNYAWALFRKADAVRPGTYAVLDAKALKLTGAADSPPPPASRSTYAWLMDTAQADVFHCTNAVAAQREVPRLHVLQVPPELQVGADYGLSVRSGAPQGARDFATFVLSPAAQQVFARLGFGAP